MKEASSTASCEKLGACWRSARYVATWFGTVCSQTTDPVLFQEEFSFLSAGETRNKIHQILEQLYEDLNSCEGEQRTRRVTRSLILILLQMPRRVFQLMIPTQSR